MSDYIDREAARPDAFCSGVSCQECPFCKDHIYGGCRVDDFIMALPAADVRHVVRGKWVEKKHATTHGYFCRMALSCSVCGQEIDYGRGYGSNYCGNCGADMREARVNEHTD